MSSVLPPPSSSSSSSSSLSLPRMVSFRESEAERAEPAYGSEDRSYIRFLVSCFSVQSPPLYIYELHAYFHTPASSFTDPVAPNYTLEPTHKPPWYGVSRALHWLTGHYQFFFHPYLASAPFQKHINKKKEEC